MAKVSGIYVILNTKNGKVYIGQAQDFRERWRDHTKGLNGNYHGNQHLQRAWNKYGAKVFKFQKLEYCEIEQLDEREQHYLDIYMPKGMCYNIAKDVRATGRGRIVSDETRRKIGEASKNRSISDETRRKISEANKRRPPMSEETRRKISEANKRRPPMSDETRRKSSEAKKGKKASDETRRKISEAKKGRILSDETRLKISEALKGEKHPNFGRTFSDETRRKLSEATKNISDETRRRISEAAKNRPRLSQEALRKRGAAISVGHARRRAEREAAANALTEGGEA